MLRANGYDCIVNKTSRLPLCILASVVTLFVAGCATLPSTPPKSPTGACSRGTIGIEPTDISFALRASRSLGAEVTGAAVDDVLPGSPAEKAGIRKGDVIVRVGERKISNACDAIEALFAFSCAPVGIELLRDAGTSTLEVVPVEQNAFLNAACDAGSAKACFRLAWAKWSGSGIEPDQGVARALYRQACDAGAAEACAYLGYHLLEQKAPAEKVVRMLARACELGSGAGCAHLAYMYATGTLVERDDAMSTPIYVRACELGDAKGCYNVGIMYRDGRGVAADRDRAIVAYEQGCRDGSSTACTDLGWYYQNGEGVAKDEARGVELFRRGCEGTSCQPPNRRGCVNLGLTYRDGIGVDADPKRAESILRAACEDEVDADDVDPGNARAHACSLLGSMYLIGGELAADPKKGLEYSARGCEGSDPFGCYNAAVIYAAGMGVEPDMTRAADYYLLACDYDDAEACDALATLYERGEGVEKDHARAKALYEKSCAAGFKPACAPARR
jgi:TPR repeat protein